MMKYEESRQQEGLEQIITIELPLKQLKLMRDSMYKVSYSELESINGNDIPYAFSDLEKSIGEADDILGA
jgi:hypothetical protein